MGTSDLQSIRSRGNYLDYKLVSEVEDKSRGTELFMCGI